MGRLGGWVVGQPGCVPWANGSPSLGLGFYVQLEASCPVCTLSLQSCLFVTLWTVACQTSL